MRVLCVDSNKVTYLTQGKSYEVVDKTSTCFILINDDSTRFSYDKKRFEEEIPTIVFYTSGYLMESKTGFNLYKFSDLSSLGSDNSNYKKILAKFKEWLINEDL
jgi:hypothetical protein